MSEHIHTRSDGRGARDVFVNGNKIKYAIRADTKKGLVIFVPQPLRANRSGTEIYTRALRGEVKVVFL